MNTLHSMRILHNPIKSAGMALVLLFTLAGMASEASAQLKLPNAGSSVAQPTAPARVASVAPAAGQPQLVDAIVAVVNNEVITRRELIDRSAIIERRLASQGGTPPRAELQRQILERMIVERAQLQLAEGTGHQGRRRLAGPRGGPHRRAKQAVVAGFPQSAGARRHAVRPIPRRSAATKSSCSACASGKWTTRSRFPIPRSTIIWQRKPARPARRQELKLAHILVRMPENASPEQIAAAPQACRRGVRQLQIRRRFCQGGGHLFRFRAKP